MGKITSIHDKFIRSIFGDKQLAADYFKSYLPAELSTQLDFGTLEQLPDSYLSKQLQRSMSDIVYTCALKKNKKTLKIALLIEHKSRIEKYAPIQIGSYLYSGYQKQVANKEDLSVIVPILFYHGREKWAYKTLSNLFENSDASFQQFIPSFDYIYNDLSLITDLQLETLSNQFLAACFLSMKHAMDEHWLKEHALSVFSKAVTGTGNQIETFAVYFFNNSKVNEDQVIEILELIPEPVKDHIMNTFDVFEQKGIEKGKLQLIKVLLTNTDFTVSKIAALSEASEELVIAVRTEIENDSL